MKATTVLICVFIKKTKLDIPVGLLPPIRGAADVIEPLFRPTHKEGEEASSPVISGSACAQEDFYGILDVLVITVVVALMFISFAFTDTNSPKHSKDETLGSGFLFSSRTRVKICPENQSSQTKCGSVSEQYGDKKALSGFKKGFLVKSKASRSAKRRRKVDSLASEIDAKRKAKVIENGNVSLVYELYDSDGKETAIFKPFSDPRKNANLGSNSLVVAKASHCINEVAAYNFDRSVSAVISAGIPETQLVDIPSSLIPMSTGNGLVRGSIQKFLPGTENCEDFGSSIFTTTDVHKIGILDIRILNCDRHTGNMLFHNGEKKLYPIDHALSFPEVSFDFDDVIPMASEKNSGQLTLADISYDWMLFPQAKEPFANEALEAIAMLDIQKDLLEMKKLGMNVKQRMSVYMSQTLLQKASIELKKTLYEIGSLIQRTGDRSERSVIEHLAVSAMRNVNLTALENGDEMEFTRFCAEFDECLNIFFKL